VSRHWDRCTATVHFLAQGAKQHHSRSLKGARPRFVSGTLLWKHPALDALMLQGMLNLLYCTAEISHLLRLSKSTLPPELQENRQ
jgi:hypothetical protein